MRFKEILSRLTGISAPVFGETLTSVSCGDILPASGHARSLAIVEAVIGGMYPAV